MINKTKKSGIYKIINIINNKYYIGSSINLYRRFKNHFNDLIKNKHKNKRLQNAWNKYGQECFIFEVIEEVKPIKDKLLDREQYYLDILNPYYNICIIAGNTIGTKHTLDAIEKMKKSHLGKKASKETRQKMSKALSGSNNPFFQKKGIEHPVFGRHHTTLAKEKIRNARQGEKSTSAKLTEQQVLEIREKYKTGKYTQQELGNEYDISRSGIEQIVLYKTWKYL